MEIRLLTPGDEAVLERVAPGVFDRAVDPELAREFLRDRRHHITVALEQGIVVGFASGVHYLHPDKPPELFVNEVAVGPAWRGRGIGRRVLRALLDHGQSIGCHQAWALTGRDNLPAAALYRSAGGRQAEAAMVSFDLVAPA